MIAMNYEDEIKNLKILVDNLKQENNRLRSSREESGKTEGEVEKLKQDIRNLDGNLARLRQENGDLKNSLNKKKLEIEEVKISNLRDMEDRVNPIFFLFLLIFFSRILSSKKSSRRLPKTTRRPLRDREIKLTSTR